MTLILENAKGLKRGEGMSNTINLWHDKYVLGGMDILKAACRTYRYDAHSHECFVIAAFRAGAQKHKISGKHGVAIPGTVMIIPPGEVHTGESAMREIGWAYSAFYPSASNLGELSKSLFEHAEVSLDFGTAFIIEDRELSDKLLLAADIAYHSNDVLRRQEAIYGAFEMLTRRYGQRTRHCSLQPLATASIRKACEYIYDNFHRNLTVEEIADQVNLSKFHFMRQFKIQKNLTVHQYVIHRRLEVAKTMLAHGKDAATVASSVGLYDQSHFISHFKRSFGLTPKRYASACR